MTLIRRVGVILLVGTFAGESLLVARGRQEPSALRQARQVRPLRFCLLSTFYPPWNFGGDGIHVQRLERLAHREAMFALANDRLRGFDRLMNAAGQWRDGPA